GRDIQPGRKMPNRVRKHAEGLVIGGGVLNEVEDRTIERIGTERNEWVAFPRQIASVLIEDDVADGVVEQRDESRAVQADLLAELRMLELREALQNGDGRAIVVLTAQGLVVAIPGDELQRVVVREVPVDRQRRAPGIRRVGRLRVERAVADAGIAGNVYRAIGHARINEV